MEDEGMNITILGMLLILGAIVLLALTIRALLNEGRLDSGSSNQTVS